MYVTTPARIPDRQVVLSAEKATGFGALVTVGPPSLSTAYPQSQRSLMHKLIHSPCLAPRSYCGRKPGIRRLRVTISSSLVRASPGTASAKRLMVSRMSAQTG